MHNQPLNLRMRLAPALVTLTLATLVLAACGASPGGQATERPSEAAASTSGEPSTPVPSVAPASGIVLELTAQQPTGKDLGWDVWELTAPADLSFDIAYTNDDVGRHDFAVLPAEGTLSQLLFKSEMVQGSESGTLTVPGLPAGTYDFVCSLHSSTMRGTLTIE